MGSLTFETVCTGTLEDNSSDEELTWLRIALSTGIPGSCHAALQLYAHEITLMSNAYQTMWQSRWNP